MGWFPDLENRGASRLAGAGLFTIATVSPLLPLDDPRRFAEVCAVDGTRNVSGVVDIFREIFGGDDRVGISRAGFNTVHACSQEMHPPSLKAGSR